ncbi:hypothetical protein GCM10017581_086690 [Dactylosporangium matsuzakiense]|uniref:ABC-2 type transport system ATP-binding protein n=1 Tax=Dactylosporangium matsuzakiense TaxID=53360 RepID=A0A9W6KUG5_9ACTN|nr:hypothetical protein [Dactylosporangium matsuzakiense]GLL06919.1 hypothetical protein GCM10017581_086690 [Dactylosporangium matsuzakiense]
MLDEPTSGLDPLMEQLFQHCVRQAAAAGRTVLLSSHILAEAETLCESVTIIKDGRLVESGQLAGMRHLAASAITAQVPTGQVPAVTDRLRSAGLGDPGAEAGRLRLNVPRQQVAAVLEVLADADAQDITCTPATLEDLFLRHYETVAR